MAFRYTNKHRTSNRAMKALIFNLSTIYSSKSTAETTMIRIVNVDIIYSFQMCVLSNFIADLVLKVLFLLA